MQGAVPAAGRRWSCQEQKSDSRPQTLQSQADTQHEESDKDKKGT